MDLTVPEAARRAGRSAETIRRWIWSGKLPARKIGNQHFIDSRELEALFATPAADDDGPLPEVRGDWGPWLARAEALQRRLRAKGVQPPPGSDLIHDSRRGR